MSTSTIYVVLGLRFMRISIQTSSSTNTPITSLHDIFHCDVLSLRVMSRLLFSQCIQYRTLQWLLDEPTT